MKKLLFILAVGMALFAKADYIYWMVDNPASGTDISGSSTTFYWSTAALSIQETGDIYANSTYSEASASGVGTLTSTQASDFKDIDAYAHASIGESSAYSDKYFLIELFASDGSWMAGYSASASSESIAKYIFGDNSMSVMPAAGFGQGATYNVPEPTSGLLFLVGGMLLGLKRRRQV